MNYANIILEMLERIKKLETEVELLKQREIKDADAATEEAYTPKMSLARPTEMAPAMGKRDKTRYMFDGNIYLKNRLVLAVVQRYIFEHPGLTRFELKKIFSKSLQGSIGVVENVELAEQRVDFNVRFFVKESEILHLTDGDMYVCNQWGVLNIPNFIKAAENLGYKIEAI